MKAERDKMTIQRAALKLLRNPQFLYLAGRQVGEMGVVRELLNRHVLFLAGLTRKFPRPVSVLYRGSSSTGKSTLVESVVQLFPPESVARRATLSARAPVYGRGIPGGKILYLREYRGSKDAMLLTRLMQSEGAIEHEYTDLAQAKKKRGTKVVRRKGVPVVLSTTTALELSPDDETRFLTLRADESSETTRAVIRAQFRMGSVEKHPAELEVWHQAVRLLWRDIPEFSLPAWLETVADHIPADDPRARRDVPRFLSLLQAVALCLSWSDGRRSPGVEKQPVEISFSDYCVAFLLLQQAFTSTYSRAHPQALILAEGVRRLIRKTDKPVAAADLATFLGWERSLVYKWVQEAIEQNLIKYSVGTRQHNLKLLLPGAVQSRGFLPHPQVIFRARPEIGEQVRVIDPITGKPKIVKRQRPGEI